MLPFWVYMLRCSDDTYYVGHTDDLDRRVAEHQSGKKRGYTRKRRPVTLVWCDTMPSRDDAKEREDQLKGWSRAKKEALIRDDWQQIELLGLRRNPWAT